MDEKRIEPLNIEGLDAVTIIGDKSVEACFALGVELFIDSHSDNIEVYKNLLSCIEKYYINFKDYLNGYLLPNATIMSRIKGNPIPRWYSALDKLDQNYGYGMNVYYDNRQYEGVPIDATPWQASCFGEKNGSQYLSAISASMAVCNTNGVNNFATLFSLTQQWCERLKPAHGSAGFFFAYAPDMEPQAKFTWPLLQRYPGVDHHDITLFSVKSQNVNNRIKGVNWLTVLCDEIVSELGGQEFIQLVLGEQCKIHPYNGGVIIVAGPIPQLGDTYVDFVPERYKSVARLTKPVRFENYTRPFLKLPKPIDAVEATLKWIRRFD